MAKRRVSRAEQAAVRRIGAVLSEYRGHDVTAEEVAAQADVGLEFVQRVMNTAAAAGLITKKRVK